MSDRGGVSGRATTGERGWRPVPGDLVALAVLVGVPSACFVIAAVVGRPIITGDNLLQNYPLRVLVGEAVRQGHLPLYDPYQWSGTALLGGINASAAFPPTWLFALLPGLGAWVATESSSFAAATAGLYLFLRYQRLSPLPAALGAATFGLGGFLAAQANHIDVVQTGACLSWSLLALERTANAPRHQRPLWAALLAAAVASFGLVGSPETGFYAVLGAVVYGVHLLVRSGGRRRSTLAWFALACLLGVLLAAVQLLPAERFVEVSQRSSGSYAFLTAGSLRPAQLLFDLAPHILGGGPIGLTRFAGSYNLGELDGYPGTAALVAVVALLARWRAPEARRWRVWYLIGGVGVLLALGNTTPLPHLLLHLPIVDKSRLPSRGLILFALAAAVLLAYWAEDLLDAPRARRGPREAKGASHPPAVRGAAAHPWGWREIAAGLVAPVAILAVLAAVAIGGAPVASFIGGGLFSRWSVAGDAPYLATAAALALAVGTFVALAGRLGPRRRALLLAVLVVADLVVATVDQTSLAPTSAPPLGGSNALERVLARVVGPGGRFLIDDPQHFGYLSVDDLGQPNLNGLDGLLSAQGYTSLTWGPYATATGTHGDDVVDPAALAGTVFDALDVRALLALPSSFRTGARDLGPSDHPAPAGQALTIAPGTTTRYFGGAVEVGSITLTGTSKESRSALDRLAETVRLVPAGAPGDRALPGGGAGGADGAGGGIGPDGVSRAGDSSTLTFPSAARAAGVVVHDGSDASLAVRLVVRPTTGAPFVLDGPLASAVTGPHWASVGTDGPYGLFANTRARGPYYGEPLPGRTGTPRFTLRVVSSSPTTATETVSVDSSAPFRLVRSVADIPGWRVTVVRNGRSRTVVPTRSGLVQSVELGAGRSRLTYTYSPPGLRPGIVLTLLGCLGLTILAGLGLVRGRRRPGRVLRDRRVASAVLSKL